MWFPGWFLLDHSFLFDKGIGNAWLQQCHDLLGRMLYSLTPSAIKLRNQKWRVYFLKKLWCSVDERVKQVRITSFSGRANCLKKLKIFHGALFICAFPTGKIKSNLLIMCYRMIIDNNCCCSFSFWPASCCISKSLIPVWWMSWLDIIWVCWQNARDGKTDVS